MKSMHILFLLSLSIFSTFIGNAGNEHWLAKYCNATNVINTDTNGTIHFAITAVNSDEWIGQLFGLMALIKLVNRGYYIDEAIHVVQATVNRKKWHKEWNSEVHVLKLLEELVKRGKCIELAYQRATNLLSEEDNKKPPYYGNTVPQALHLTEFIEKFQR